MNKNKRNRGITLIALIVIIIVLLILAGVTIASLTGENGILTRARSAKTVNEKAAIKEQLELAVLASRMQEGVQIDLDILDENVVPICGRENIAKQGKDDQLPWQITKDGYIFQITEDESVISVEGILLDSTELKLLPGETKKLTATKTKGTEGTVEWSSSDEAIATVSSDGTVTVKAEATAGSTATITAKVNGTKYKAECTVKVIPRTISVSATQVAAKPKEYYGKKVENYKASDSDTNTYRIFYVDTANDFKDGANTIYLKADYSGGCNLNNYSTYDVTKTKVKEMNPDWAANKGTTESSWNTNEKAAAYLCSPIDNTNYTDGAVAYPWKSYYMNNENVNYVIGGPSAEMYVKSYNQAYNGETGSNIYTLGTSFGATSIPGYIYSLNGEQSTISYSDYYTGNDSLDFTKYNSMYCGKTGSNTGFWWLASPSGEGSNKVCYVNGPYAYLGGGDYSLFSGLSPLVSLKSNFTIEILE